MNNKQSIWTRLHIDLPFLLCIIVILIYSLIILWSASGQSVAMLQNKTIQLIIGLVVMLFVAQFSPRFYEKIAFPLYVITLILLILVDATGDISKGAQRWLNLGFIRFQPSEIAKIAVPLMVAKFINRDSCPPSFLNILIAFILTAVPTLLIALQPDLGTAILTFAAGIFIIFLAGMSWKLISAIVILIAGFIPVFWFFLIHEYQRMRVLTLLNPESDPLGLGYHIIQSKIAIGSGGIFGKGWLHGTQSQLEFLPERYTDFIFAVLAEELGLVGAGILLALYIFLIIRGLMIAAQAQTTFGRLLASGFMLIFFVYVFVNIGMVSGILPVVGVPLPLISYGGSSLLILMTSFGMIMSIHTHRKMLSKKL